MLSGRLFEDFVPVSETLALVTTGWDLEALDCVEWAEWCVLGAGRVLVTIPPAAGHGIEVRDGVGVRLGGQFGIRRKLLYSDRARGVVGAEVASPTAHQPFLYDGDVYYTDDWPLVRIYHGNHKVFLDHFAGHRQVGNPHWTPGGVMYFETRKNSDPKRPDLWEVWRRLGDGTLEYVCRGANPAYYGGRLFWGEWNGRSFDYQCATVD